jgi:magnesium transporter
MSEDTKDEHVENEEAEAAIAPSGDEPQHVATRIEEIPAADGADVMEGLPKEKAADVAEYLDPNTAGDILAEMEPALAASVITDMEPPEASMVLAAMDPDDRVDILSHISAPLHDQIIGEMSATDAADVRNLEQYPPDTAGGIMTTQVTRLPEHFTVEEAIAELRRLAREYEQLFYVYVVDARNHLIGVLSMRDLILAKPGRKLSEIMIASVASVPATMDQEEVARIMQKYGYLAMPVVDGRNKLLGIITVDDVVHVLEQEATEDVQKMFGAGAEERLTSPWHFSFRKRLPWLEVNLGTAFLATLVVTCFHDTVEKFAVLAAYMPVVAGMGGNASAQAMAVAIRGISRGEMDSGMLRKVFQRELIVGCLSGLVIGTTAMLIAWFFHYDHGMMLGIVVGAALVINHTLACIWGVAIPFAMKSLGFDPAQSATIFTTTLTDIVGFFSLLGLASLLMRWLVP